MKDFSKYLFNHFGTMVANNVKLSYEGEITHQITKALTALAESQMISEDESGITQKKVFHVIVESLQNITKHAEEISEDEQTGKTGKGLFLVIKDTEYYVITSGNIVSNDKTAILTSFLEKINSTDKEGLKELYKTQIKEGRISDKGGAGLGLIDIARKSGNKLEYSFTEINSNYSFFLLTMRVTRDH